MHDRVIERRPATRQTRFEVLREGGSRAAIPDGKHRLIQRRTVQVNPEPRSGYEWPRWTNA